MTYRRFYAFVEGGDDLDFFRTILSSLLERVYNSVDIHSYQEQSLAWVNDFLRNVRAMGAEYVFVRDIHETGKLVPCVHEKKQEILHDIRALDSEHILLVRYEIEGWYLAGLNQEHAERLGVAVPENSDALTKEQFDRLMPRRYRARAAFMNDILACYDLETAKRKNRSFRYFCEKYLNPAS